MLCSFSDVFGRPGEGVHSVRLAGVAVVDLGLTIGAAWLLSRWLLAGFWKVLLALLLLGVVAHRLFCVRTAVDGWLFG